jgi:hypothetical protein
MNTHVTYHYTDAANYHLTGGFVVAGELHFAAIEPFLDEGEFFLPRPFGLPDLWAQRPRIDPDDDHPWHRFEYGEEDFLPTTRPATSIFTAESLIEAFRAAHAAGWSDEMLLTEEIAELAEPFVPEGEEEDFCENCDAELVEGEDTFCTRCAAFGGDEEAEETKEAQTDE